MTITELGDFLRLQPRAWRDIPQQYRSVAMAALLPAAGFDARQREWLSHWWLACTADDVSAINALLPDGTRVSPIEVEGALYLGGDLLTDALQEGGTYHAALPVIETLICTYIEALPQPEGGMP